MPARLSSACLIAARITARLHTELWEIVCRAATPLHCRADAAGASERRPVYGPMGSRALIYPPRPHSYSYHAREIVCSGATRVWCGRGAYTLLAAIASTSMDSWRPQSRDSS